ncbi:neural cell adhesion molecule 2-like [Lycorma delicatula]|uniref:neural cell adhesion molecule 2-like n=1 Tax=Lycorma delicatula TaxID=130591 RepID=UPI003F511729
MRIAFTLVTIKPISFRSTPDLQNATENESMLVKCEADGDPDPNVYWFLNGTTSPEGPRYMVTAKGLYIRNVTLDDRGMYQCRAMQMSPTFADMATKTIQLKVFHKPKWKTPNQTNQELAYGYLSGVVNLTCEAIADPEPQFTWRRNNEVIAPEHHNATVINEPQRSILQLPVHNESAFGEYKCEANNSVGRVERIIILQQGIKPEPPKLVTVGDTKIHTADLHITGLPHEDGIIGYRIQFVIKLPGIQHTWDAPEYQDFMKDTSSGSTSSVFTVIDLLENTEYAVRVASRNAAGLSDFTEELHFRTKSSETNDVTSVYHHFFIYSYAFIMLYMIFLNH